jgi:hypothetical protein
VAVRESGHKRVTENWQPEETSVHQDHVIAHVIGATVLGYFVFDEVLYILLDIGFIWMIFLDGQMTLLPHPVAVNELEIEEGIKEDIKADVGVLLGNLPESLLFMTASPGYGQLTDVSFERFGEQRRLTLVGEELDLIVVTSLDSAEIRLSGTKPTNE